MVELRQLCLTLVHEGINEILLQDSVYVTPVEEVDVSNFFMVCQVSPQKDELHIYVGDNLILEEGHLQIVDGLVLELSVVGLFQAAVHQFYIYNVSLIISRALLLLSYNRRIILILK